MQQRTQLMAALLCAVLGLAAPGHGAVQVRILGEPATISPAPQVRDGILLGAPESIVGRLGCRFLTDEGGALTILSASGRRLVLRPGSDRLTVDGREQVLPAQATVAGGRLICPLRPVLEALGALVRWDQTSGWLDIETHVAAIEVYADEQGARVEVRSELPLSGALSHLEDPERWYLDLPGGTVADLEHERTLVNLGAVVRVRWGQFAEVPAIARVVVDMREPAEATWQPAADGRGGSIIVGTVDGDEPRMERHMPRIERLLTSNPDTDTTLVTVELSDPAPYEYDVRARPPQVTLTLPDATAQAPIAPVTVAGPFVRTARLDSVPEQPGTTLTLSMRQLVHFQVAESADPPAITLVFHRGRLAGKRIVVDPGHGGRDTGARGTLLLEKDVNLDVARQVAARLVSLGALVTLTRESDVFVDLYDRPRLANRLGADMFVSIHCNAMPRPNTGLGTETYYYHSRSKCLAVVLHESLVQALGRRDNGVRWANFCVTRESEMPAVLVELMYINTDEEQALLAQPEVRAAAAAGIVEGLRRYVEGTGSVPVLDTGELGQ